MDVHQYIGHCVILLDAWELRQCGGVCTESIVEKDILDVFSFTALLPHTQNYMQIYIL